MTEIGSCKCYDMPLAESRASMAAGGKGRTWPEQHLPEEQYHPVFVDSLMISLPKLFPHHI